MHTKQFFHRLCAPGEAQIDLPVAIICAHPDDETIGAGTRLVRLRRLAIVHVTDGAPRTMEDAARYGFESCAAYSAARREELAMAVKLGGVQRHQLYELGFADQAAASNLIPATHAICNFLKALAPAIVITHAYEGGHPDHDATAFAVHAACQLFKRTSGASPVVVEMASYHSRNGIFTAGEFLPADCSAPEVTAWLTPGERSLKKRMFACFRTQASVLTQFEFFTERFRLTPNYDFGHPPHSGTLYYEQHPWGMTGARFCSHVADAVRGLHLAANLLV